MKPLNDLKVAIVCDWLTGIGGAELVVLELHKMFPKAPIYTSQYDPTKIDWFYDADIRTTWINKLPKKLKKFLPVLRAISFSKLDLSDYDLVLSSSGAEAKSVKTGPGTVHVCYCHSPTHYYWERYEEYLKNPGFGSFDWLARIGLKTLVGPMRRWDFKAAQKPNYLIANSNYIKSNILKYYKRDSVVIHPPVEVSKYAAASKTSSERIGFVVTGRQTPYKRIDLAVSACSKLNLDLTVIGDGPDHAKLQAMAGPTITFVGRVDEGTKIKLLGTAKAFILPGVDDFGISAIEALASGTPVIAFKAGGALDYVNKTTGLMFDHQTTNDLCLSLEHFNKQSFDHHAIKAAANKFSSGVFVEKLSDYLSSLKYGR